jgi:hypothetical protein
MRLPDFLVIGTSRGGTTSLYHLLRAADGIFMPERTEVHFFSLTLYRNPNAPLSDYARNFSKAREDEVAGEKSPSYFWFAGAADAIRQRLPNVRLIATLRDPAERAISDFKIAIRPAPGEDALLRLIDGGIRDLVKGKPFKTVVDPAVILWKGMYGQHIKRFLKLFGEERLLFIDFDSFGDSRRVLQETASFIGAPPISTALPHENASPAATATYDRALARLREFYRKADDYEAVRTGLRII